MQYTLWYYKLNNDGEFYQAYDIMTGSRYECYKERNRRDFRHQYKVLICTW